MIDTLPIVRKLQADALDPGVPVVSLLRTAKIIAIKLNLNDALVWIDRELDGYMDLPVEELPPYRRLQGVPQAFNPYHGWQTIHFEDPEHADIFSQAPIGMAIGALEKDLVDNAKPSKRQLAFPYSPAARAQLQKAIHFPTDVNVRLDYGSVWNIVEQVRNLVLNWTLELEKAGIVGENMTFTEEERKEAGVVTAQYFHIQNVGVLGDVSGHAAVSGQIATQQVSLNIEQLRDTVSQARNALPLLPESTQHELVPILDDVECELKSAEPNNSKLRELLKSARTICEGAAGNLAASGLGTLIGRLLAG